MSAVSSRWRKSSRCESSACVEVILIRDDCRELIAVRSDVQLGSACIHFAVGEWETILKAIKHDPATTVGELVRTLQLDDEQLITLGGGWTYPTGIRLIFTRTEWDVFVGGVGDGEFDLDRLRAELSEREIMAV